MKISKKSLFSFVFLIVLCFSFASLSLPAKADQALYNSQVGMNDVQTVYGKKTPQDVRELAVKIIIVLLGFLGLIFFCLIIYAGFNWMTSAGSEEKIKESKKLITNAAIGLIIVMISWAITKYFVYVSSSIVNDRIDYTTYPNY